MFSFVTFQDDDDDRPVCLVTRDGMTIYHGKNLQPDILLPGDKIFTVIGDVTFIRKEEEDDDESDDDDEEEEEELTTCGRGCLPDWDIRCCCEPNCPAKNSMKQFNACPQKVETLFGHITNEYVEIKECLLVLSESKKRLAGPEAIVEKMMELVESADFVVGGDNVYDVSLTVHQANQLQEMLYDFYITQNKEEESEEEENNEDFNKT